MDKDKSLNKRVESMPSNIVSLLGKVRHKIIQLRDCQVILDVDIAELYGVETGK